MHVFTLNVTSAIPYLTSSQIQTMKLLFLYLFSGKQSMRSLAAYVCFIYFSTVLTATSILGVLKNHPSGKSDELLHLNSSMKKPGVRSIGIFERFLQNLLNALIDDFPERLLGKYLSILYHELEDMDYGPTRRLGRTVKKLAHMYREDITQELIKYRHELNRNLPHRTEFLNAMNDVFTRRESMFFDDYVYDVINYGKKEKLFIDQETRNLLRNVIEAGVQKLSRRDRWDLKKKMKSAAQEYRGEFDYSSDESF